ncbi:MAG: hypothetical protein ACRD2N_25215 [Vicinamibacterales bacterium]
MTERARPRPVPALYAGIVLAAAQIGFYLQMIAPFISFPADLLMWGETDFTGNIIRLRSGQPLYSPVSDLNSSTYPPLASIVTYGVTKVLQLPASVPTLRLIQMSYVVLTVALGLVSWRMLRRLLIPNASHDRVRVWSVLVALTLFLVATAPGTGQWVHALHTDAVVLLWSTGTFLALIWYLSRPSLARLVVLAVAPAIGFAIKQYTLIWAPIIFFTLLIDDHRKFSRLVQLVAFTTAFTGLGVLIAYLFWGPDYIFWVFQVVGGDRSRLGLSAGGFELSLPRATDHLLRSWPLSLGFIGGWLLLTRFPSRRAAALWTPWLLLLTAEALTSGTGWDARYHFGPGAVVGAIWLFTVLPEAWPETSTSVRMIPVVRSAWSLAGLTAMFLALGTVPSGEASDERYWNQSPFPRAYTEAIEAEFQGYDPADVLMDWGNWTYLPTNHLALDRAVAMFELPTAGRYDLLEPLLHRIRSRRYKKVIVHRYHAGSFTYDWSLLDRPTGIRTALQENYEEVRTIEGLSARPGPLIQYRGPVSVLVPKRD